VIYAFGDFELDATRRVLVTRAGTPVEITVNGRPLAFSTFNRANIMPGSFDVNWDNYYKGMPVFNIKKFQFPGAWRVGNAAPFYSGFRNPFESNETLAVTKKFSWVRG